MMNSNNTSNPDPKDKQDPETSRPVTTTHSKPFTDVVLDPDYVKLTDYYQHGDFEKCNELLVFLLKRYPDNRRLLDFQKDLQMQLSLKNMSATYSQQAKEKQKKKTIKMSVFTVIASVVVVMVFLGSFYLLSRNIINQRQKSNEAQLASLQNQVIELLQSGQPKVAAQIIEQMRAINSEYASLPALSERTNTQLMLETKYQAAKDLIQQGDYSNALNLLNEIETTNPGLWDVRRQIEKAQTMINVATFMQSGNQAYQAGNWAEVITAYENALSLDPELEDPVMKEQLLNGYLRRIIQMLENDGTAVQDIENAEQYYRKAVAMIPQSKAFASERENLQKVSSSLLQLKFTQTAKSLLQEQNQTFSSITKAVSYLNKAANLDPKNAQLQTELRQAQIYQIAFQYYLDMNWGLAIENLNKLMEVDQGYASGNAKSLLYESYYALGSQYYSVGVYTDARKNLEQAEILAYEDRGNLLKLFQVQMLLGDTIAKSGDYANAVSYYQYALNNVNAYSRVSGDADLSARLVAADGLATAGNTRDAASTYLQIHQDISRVFTMNEVDAPDGACLAFFAAANASTSDAIITANGLPKSSIITFGRKIKVPTLN